MEQLSPVLSIPSRAAPVLVGPNGMRGQDVSLPPPPSQENPGWFPWGWEPPGVSKGQGHEAVGLAGASHLLQPPKNPKGSPAGPEAGDGQEERARSELFLGQH